MTKGSSNLLREAVPPLMSEGTAELQRERAILDAIEEEQFCLAQELHDTVCQSLSGLRLSTVALRRNLQSVNGKVADAFDQVEEVAAKAIGDLHEIVRSLQPVEIEPKALDSCLQELADSIAEQVRSSFERIGLPAVPDVFTASQVFRIARDTVKYALANGPAGRITLRWSEGKKGSVLEVCSELPCYATIETSAAGLFGWKLLQRRAKAIGATLAANGEGNCVSLTLAGQHPTSDIQHPTFKG